MSSIFPCSTPALFDIFYLFQIIRAHNAPRHYIPPPLAGIKRIGKPISVEDTMMTSMSMPASNFSILDNDTIRDFVFVTGASSNHFQETKDAIAGVQTHMPGYKLLYYDLGLTPVQIKEVLSIRCVYFHSYVCLLHDG
jgi:hypothetical protein